MNTIDYKKTSRYLQDIEKSKIREFKILLTAIILELSLITYYLITISKYYASIN